jgi:low-affinity ferrous iron transport protein
MGLLSKISRILCSPGRQREVECAAPTQFIFQENKKEGAFEVTGENVPNVQLYNPEKRKSRGGRFFDSITHVAGSRITFVFTLILLIVWAVIGGVLGAPEIWQIVMQDVSSIQCYASDCKCLVN